MRGKVDLDLDLNNMFVIIKSMVSVVLEKKLNIDGHNGSTCLPRRIRGTKFS